MLRFESTIDLSNFEKKYNRFMKDLDAEMRIALVNTREDFITRMYSLLGSVPETGGRIPSPYVGVYQALSEGWIKKKIRWHYMLPIGVATGETAEWLINLSRSPETIVQIGQSIEIEMKIEQSPFVSPEAKIFAMETGTIRGQPPRPIFEPVVVWYFTQEGRGSSPFYLEAIKARDRAIARVYGS